tara:strand:- start:64 stop:2028 length:1965 start_codon:yes stop_codon:yes gene_type:complete
MQINPLKELSKLLDISNISDEDIKQAIYIRLVEKAFLRLFSEGKMNGTVHTCVGQEFSAVSICKHLDEDDWVTSNHRCHGHFICKTGNWKGLIDELMGLKSGVSKGIGSSQHLYAKGFLSNGIQGSLLPVGTGIALYKKINKEKNIVVSFIGEGTLGEGASYEAFNLSSLHQTPQLFVCENNFYSQSTPQNHSVPGNITDRPKSFGIKVFEANTWEVEKLNKVAFEAIQYVRKGKPAFLNISTYRLNAHSKGDDDRDPKEIDYFFSKDPLSAILSNPKWSKEADVIKETIDNHIKSVKVDVIDESYYCKDQLPRFPKADLVKYKNPKKRMVNALNEAYLKTLDNGAFLIGEDIMDPYGGAFKVTKGFSSKYPNQVFYSSISESGMVGISIGMALMGVKSYTEIMFGDFLTLTFDQIVNNASKMHHMYAFQNSVPLRVRTPMGGKRGYGPTHSQSLEKFFVGIDNILVLSMTSLIDPLDSILNLEKIDCPTIIIENKLDYGRMLWSEDEYFSHKVEDKPFGDIVISPVDNNPTLTIVSYGETARNIADNLNEFFQETDQIPELICLTKLHPLDLSNIEDSIIKTKKLLIIEDGSVAFGIGSEILAKFSEKSANLEFSYRIGADPYPIPSVSSLESKVLPTIQTICTKFLKAYNDT